MRRALAIARLVESSGTAKACLASSTAAGPALDSLSARTAGFEPPQASARPVTTSPASCSPVHIEDEIFCRQRQTIPLGNRIPVFAPDTWVAPSAVVVGDVDLYDKVSIWYGAVLRGDLNSIRIGAWSNIQDKTVIHAARTSPTGLSAATTIGRHVTIGQGCVLRSTNVRANCIIGDRSILMEGSLVEAGSILAPGSVLPPGRLVPKGQLWAGNPARYVRDLSNDEKLAIPSVAKNMFRLVDAHSAEFLPYNFAYVEAEKLRTALEEHAS
ncbi:hypothetical protein WJX74_008369 [Apatococcus lobatus]|uniref:Gamma carbonic anhydrase n=1 Tax=Apatococcus lobatus TaxID=904363 RepID=A0AAW1SBI4_9CHLO